MRVKTFQGRTLEELLPEIRRELGPDAVVLGQRPLISGGVGGFFGKRMVEVTAADRMPADEELLDLERESAHVAEPAAASSASTSRPSLDVTDEWDPAADAELAAEFGSVLRKVRDAAPAATAANASAASPPAPESAEREPANLAGTYSPLDLPRRTPTVEVTQQASATAGPAAGDHGDAPASQARRLAERAHEAIAAATREIERQLAAEAGGTAVGQTHPATSTFRAEVVPAATGPRIGFPHPQQAFDADLAEQPLERRPSPAPIPVQRPARPQSTPREPGRDISPEAAQLADLLVHAGVERDIADVVVQRAVMHRLPFTAGVPLRRLVRQLVGESIPVENGWIPMGRSHRIALVGPSGAGKSSVAAKLAEGYERGAGLRVAVVSLLAGVRQPPSHGSDPLLGRPGVDLYFAADVQQLETVLQRVEDRDLIIFDTPSAAYLDASVRTALATSLAVAKVDEVHAVLPLAMSLREAESVVEHFRALSVKRLAVTKLDESRFAGQLLNFGYRLGLPITFLSDGPSIPEDLRAASASEIASLIVPDGDADALREG